MRKLKNELEEDFRHLVDGLDLSHGYEPLSREFMRAAFVGLMLSALKMFGDEVDEELEGAEKYIEMYRKTGDSSYKEMASDELKHAGILIRKKLSGASTDEDKTSASEKERERQELQRKLSQPLQASNDS